MTNKKQKPSRSIVTLAVLTLLGVVALLFGHVNQQVPLTPKLALDLEGGTQLILTPMLDEGETDREITQEDMAEAITIIRQRVDATGVAEAEISTLGANNIVVAIPGEADEDILDLVRSSATMRFRPVLEAGNPEAADRGLATQSGDGTEDLTDEEFWEKVADLNEDGKISESIDGTPENHSDPAWISEADYLKFLTLDCTDPANINTSEADRAEEVLVACDAEGNEKYILGPADVEGTHLDRAAAGVAMGPGGQPLGGYEITLELDDEGTQLFKESSQRLVELGQTEPTRGRFAIVLDGAVIVAPTMNDTIPTGQAQITGDFTAAEAQALANQLQFGSLPLNFEVQSEQQISATLGSNHLEKGLWAGLLGLFLVVLYMIWQYRGLALLSFGSLLVAGGLTYLIVTLLSWGMGYRLSLPGVAGLIIAVGITADSFIVYFERIRDEVRDGRPLEVAVESGWQRARRTILISDAVNLVAATVLYVLAVGGVQGFAFTLGVTTVVDLITVFMFTHPVLSLLARTSFYGGGHRLSGLNPTHLGSTAPASYRGRGRVHNGRKKTDKVGVNAGPKGQLSIAEQRRLERQAEQQGDQDD